MIGYFDQFLHFAAAAVLSGPPAAELFTVCMVISMRSLTLRLGHAFGLISRLADIVGVGH